MNHATVLRSIRNAARGIFEMVIHGKVFLSGEDLAKGSRLTIDGTEYTVEISKRLVDSDGLVRELVLRGPQPWLPHSRG